MSSWAFLAPSIFLSILGLLVNAYVLLVVLGLGKQLQQTANTLLLVHLGAVETAVCFVSLVFSTGSWSINGGWCVLHGFLLALLHPVALWTVTGLNCDRYYAIAAPLHYAALVSPKRVITGLAASWTTALLLCLPPFSGVVPPYRYSPEFGCCVPDFANSNWGSASPLYGAVYAIVGLLLPTVLVTICNVKVLSIARYHRHRIASAIYEVTLSAQLTITHQRNPFFVHPSLRAAAHGSTTHRPPPRFRSAAKTVMQLLGSLYLLYFPYCGFIIWKVCGVAVTHHHDFHGTPHPRFVSFASLFLASSTPINGVLYGLRSQTLRRSLRNYWRKKTTESELQQEIQARTPSTAGSRRPSATGTTSLFSFPPLQRRMSEALLTTAVTTLNNTSIKSQSGNLQPAASCNTLRVPAADIAVDNRLIKLSASAVNLMSAHYRSDFISRDANMDVVACSKITKDGRTSPRILITRAVGEQKQRESSSFPRKSRFGHFSCERKRWRNCTAASDSSTESSSETNVWSNAQKMVKIDMTNLTNSCPLTRPCINSGNNSESSDTTDTTVTTTATIISPRKTTSERENSEKRGRSNNSNGSSKKRKRRNNSSTKKKRERVDKMSRNTTGPSGRRNSVEEIEMKEISEKAKRIRQAISALEDQEEEKIAQLRPLLAPSYC